MTYSLGPLVLTTDLIFLFRREVILDVEGLPNLLGSLTLDHVGYSLAANIEKRLDVEVVGSLWSSVSMDRMCGVSVIPR